MALALRLNETCSSVRRVPSLEAGSSTAAIIDPWQNALSMFKKSLPANHLNEIETRTTPGDIVAQVKEWEELHQKGRRASLTRAFEACINRVERFSAAIDQLAQGSGEPACLLWGCIKFVLVIAKDAAKEYRRLCEALLLITDYLPEVEIYKVTFLEYDLVQACVYNFYVSMLRFWTKACRFYGRRGLWKILRSAWVDYDAELQTLESEVKRTKKRVEKAAMAKHIEESKLARVEQHFANQVLLQAIEFHRQREITIWLAPKSYHANYFLRDQEAARAVFNPATCRWVLDKKEFQEWSNDTAIERPLLIYAKAGGGKTILSSFLIDHYQSRDESGKAGKVFYFFCKYADADKNTPVAVMRSLLYQLYEAETLNQSHLTTRIGDALCKSGQEKATDYSTLWELFRMHIHKLHNPTIVVDALDECQEPKVLVKDLIELSRSGRVRVIFTSRREGHLLKRLEKCSSLEICQEDTDGDIMAVLQADRANNCEYRVSTSAMP